MKVPLSFTEFMHTFVFPDFDCFIINITFTNTIRGGYDQADNNKDIAGGDGHCFFGCGRGAVVVDKICDPGAGKEVYFSGL